MGAEDKFFLEYQGKTLLQRAIDRAAPQVHKLIISANGDLARFNEQNLDIICDETKEQNGPLAGIVSAMQWAKNQGPSYTWFMSFASDTPHFPTHCVLALRAKAELEHKTVVYCRSGGRNHYAFALWSLASLPQLTAALSRGQRALHAVITSLPSASVEFNDTLNPFFNVNTPADWEKLRQHSNIDQ